MLGRSRALAGFHPVNTARLHARAWLVRPAIPCPPRRTLQGAGALEKVLKLQFFPCMIPHPSKAEKGGEDAYFVLEEGGGNTPQHSAAGVADGVGGWAEMGVDAGLYSKALMKWTHQRLESAEIPCAHDALAFAYRMTKMTGSCTACVVVLHKGVLETLNLGDSGFLLARPSEEGASAHYKVFFKTKEQQHTFNMPYQLGTYSKDMPQHAAVKNIEVKRGDVIVMATDGVWDNIFEEDLLKIVEESSGNLKSAAKAIAETSMRIGMSDNPTPFSTRAQAAGFQHNGGKLDDVTVVLAHVV